MALGTYAQLSTAIGTWGDRTYTSAETDEFILLTEADANLKLGSTYRRQLTATVNTDSSGIGTLPSAFVAMVSIKQAIVGALPLKQVSYDALVQRNPYATADRAEYYAIASGSFYTAPVTDDDFDLIYLAKLTGLSGSNTTNWLLTLLPNYYLFKCRAAACAFHEDFNGAAGWSASADKLLDELISQGNVAQYGNAEMTFEQAMP